MTTYSVPQKRGNLLDKRVSLPLASEKDSGVKHTHMGSGGIGFSFLKGPNDALYPATLTLYNVVVDSRYRVTRASNGSQLATGVAAAATVVLTDLPVYEANMQVNISIRNASGATKYKPFNTAAVMTEAGGSAYVIQQVD